MVRLSPFSFSAFPLLGDLDLVRLKIGEPQNDDLVSLSLFFRPLGWVGLLWKPRQKKQREPILELAVDLVRTATAGKANVHLRELAVDGFLAKRASHWFASDLAENLDN